MIFVGKKNSDKYNCDSQLFYHPYVPDELCQLKLEYFIGANEDSFMTINGFV